jgi:hypothetical protein
LEPQRKRRKGKKGRSKRSQTELGNPLTAILGRNSKAGRRAAKFLDKLDFDF